MKMQDSSAIQGKDGLTQSDRLLPMLLPSAVTIEDRDPAHLMLHAARLAAQFNYFNFSNKIDGTWQGFFSSNFNILALMISAQDYTSRISDYERHVAELGFADDATFEKGYQGLAAAVTRFANILRLLMRGINAANPPVDIAGRMQQVAIDIDNFRRKLRTPELLRPTSRDSLKTLQSTFSDLLVQYTRIQAITDYYRKNADWTTQQYPPHLGLFITFLQLYGYVGQEMNRLPGKHLDFYYRRILEIDPIPEVPDQVHLLLAPDTAATHVRLQAGEELSAEIPGRDEPLKYRLLSDTVVTGTTISALRTLFTGSRPLFRDNNSDHELIRNKQLYQGDYPCIPAATLLKTKPVPWPLLGEDQENFAPEQRTMDDAAIGLLVASPVFFLPEGLRRIRVTFYFTPASFAILTDYIRKFADASKKTQTAAQHELLSRCFVIDFTTIGKWAAVDYYSVTMPTDNVLELVIELGTAAPPITGYQPGVHGPALQNGLPTLRLIVNNNAPHNALSFFNELVIERLHLQSHVCQFRHVRLQNSIGNLSAESAFQPFGPLPAVGSYLDIKNTNVLNRYTTQLSVRIEWMDLPREPGGFSAWYAGYETGVTDESFRVAVGALKSGAVQPPVAQQQPFTLYSANPDEATGGPATITCLKDIDLKRLGFTNAPLMAMEDQESDGFFRDGAIRIELISPPQAYGHALFPRLFPEVAMYNARWWHKRKPLPNQPYTPRVKSVSLDYTLEHAEAFRDPADNEDGVELVHQYPFGFRRIYPGSELRTISFLPPVDPGSHLHIGLKDARRGEDLSLLFQLEQSNFHHTVHETGAVSWSYLQDDDWTSLSPGAILADTTNNFINTGIIRLKLPARLSTDNTTWPSGLTWLRASVTSGSPTKSRIITIQPQVTIAQRIIAPGGTTGAAATTGTGATGAAFTLPPGAITHQLRKVQGLRPIIQPFPSFGGRPAEPDSTYYVRVSERLRHKQRLLTSQDIEQLVLQQFPSLAVVKCFGASYARQMIYPGVDMQVIVIPREGADGSVYGDQPKANLATLFAVKNYLAGFSSPFINIEIGNPVYEKVKISCRIRLTNPKGSEGYYLKTLHDDIRQFLCPWIYLPGSDVKIGSRIYIPELLTFIRRRPYVAEVTAFSVIHFFNVKDPDTGELRAALVDSAAGPANQAPIEYIQGSVPEAVLVPSEHHLIGIIGKEGYAAPKKAGIGDFSIGEELLVVRADRSQTEGFDDAPSSSEDPDEYFNWSFLNT